MENIKFRNAEIKDFEEFNKIYVKTIFLGENWQSIFPNKPKEYKEFVQLVKNEEIIIMLFSEKIIGYAIVKAYDDGECIIKDIYILKEFQNRGFGRKFVNFIEKDAKKIGMKFISLMSVTMQTDRVWERLGYCSKNLSEEYIKYL
mgnify:CR=1 FL=1